MSIDERWDFAIANAKIILEQYINLQNDRSHDEYTYSSIKDAIKNYLYLADVWKRQSLAVLVWLEELTFDPVKWRDRRPFGPRAGKAGKQMMD